MSNSASTNQPALNVVMSLIAKAGSLSLVTSYCLGISLRKNQCNITSVAIIAAISTGTIIDAYSVKPILKKSAETILTRLETISGKLAVSAIKPAAITNANVVPLLKPSASNIAITIGVNINAAPSLANKAATVAPSNTI